MLKSLLQDRRGVVTWLLTQIGLLIAVGVLMASIASLAFYSDWEKAAEAKVMVSNFATFIEFMDLREFPEKITYLFPEKDYYYEVYISPDYVTIKRYDGKFEKEIVVRKPLLIHPWINPEMLNEKGAKGFYTYIGSLLGENHDGSSPSRKAESDIINEKFKEALKKYAVTPLKLDTNSPVYLEKMIVYTEEGRKEYVILYQ